MRLNRSVGIAFMMAVTLIALGASGTAQTPRAAEWSIVKPESVGFSSERLNRLHELIQGEVDRKDLVGAVTILARHGKIVDYRTYGVRDLSTGAPIDKDSIARMFSMTKPVTGVALMQLYEEGKWLPWEPIAKFVPEFAKLKVFQGADANGKPVLVDPEHPPTMMELATHTAGFTYGSMAKNLVGQMYNEKKPFPSKSLQEYIDKMAELPLLYQPGTRWSYSTSMDIEGYIVEKLSGQSFSSFMHDRIFAPLGMNDTGFSLPEEKRSRFATNYERSEGKLVVSIRGPASATENYFVEPGAASGGGGLVSTAENYWRFAQMLANGGEFGGKRILAPSTVQLIMSNHLPAKLLTGEWGIGQHVMRQGFGYGINGAVIYDPPAAGMSDGKNTYFWDGAAGTWFWVDPTNDVVFVGIIQRMTDPDNHTLLYRSHALVYQALVDPGK